MKKNLTFLISLAVLALFTSFTVKNDNKVLKPTSSSGEAIELFEKARKNIVATKDPEALKMLNQATELDNGFALAYIYKILVDGNVNNIYRTNVEKALANIDKVSSDEQAFLKIFKYDLDKQFDQMKSQLDVVQKMFPNDVWVNYILGTFNFNGSSEERDQFLAKAIELDSKFIPAYQQLITNLSYSMKLDEATKYADKYIEIRPSAADPYLKMGTIFRQQNQLDKALEHYEKAVKIDPKDELGNILLANCHVFLGNYEKAEEMYKKSYEQRIEPVYKRSALNNMAVAGVFEGNKEKAIDGFEKIRQFNVDNGAKAAAVGSRFSQAYVAAIFGDFAQSDSYMFKAKTESNSNELTDVQKENMSETYDLWKCYFECLKGNTNEATALANKYMDVAINQNLEGKLKTANLFQGIIAVKKADFEKAVEYLTKGPEDYLTWYYLGIAYQELGKTEKAVEQFSKITSANLINMNLASVKKDAIKRLNKLTNS